MNYHLAGAGVPEEVRKNLPVFAFHAAIGPLDN
jgi:hypothetical protein